MVAINSTNRVQLVNPQSLRGPASAATASNAGVAYSASDAYTSTNVIPNNYPKVTNNVPASIFPQTNTNVNVGVNPQPTTTAPTTTNPGTTAPTTTPTDPKKMKPVSMSEAQWAVKFEEKVMKQGYEPPKEEMDKYQDIVARYKANPNVQPSILEMLAAQSTMLGSQISAMRMAPGVAKNYVAIKDGIKTGGGIKGGMAGLKGLGMNVLKGTGLAAAVSGGFSLVTNGIQALQGKKEWNDVGGTVAADTALGAVSGITATLAAGGATLAAGALGATGLVSTLVVGLGAVGGAWLGDKLFRGTGAYEWVKDKVTSMFGSKSSAPATNQAQAASSQFSGAQSYSPASSSFNTASSGSVAPVNPYQNAQVYIPQ